MKTCLLLAFAALAAFGMAQTGGGSVKETKQQRDQRMGWWREARLGMFIHWGLYAIPAGQWKDATGHGEWIRETAQIPVGEYEQFRDQFNPVKFDANAWVKMAKDAGMQYIVITTKHHDGFALFDSKYTDWDVMSTPFKRDIMKELSQACATHGVKMCWYHSIMDWHHPDYLPRRTWEDKDRPVDGAQFPRYVDYLRNQVSELLTNYGPIGVMWFDGEWESTWNDHWGKPLYDLCRELQPNVIVNNRVSVSRGGSMEESGMPDDAVGDFSTPEQYIPPTGLKGVDWETCMTMNDHWGWNKTDPNWKSSKELIRNIVDIASKGGNYLLNVGPKADGEFPAEAIERLAAIGKWMGANGQSIYGTSASVFSTLPWGRCTTKQVKNGTELYLHVFDWPKDGKLIVPGIGNEPSAAKLLANGESYKVRRSGANLVVEVPRTAPDAICSTVALSIEGAPVIYNAPVIKAASAIIVKEMPVSIDSGSKELEVRYTLDGKKPTAKSMLYKRPFIIHRTTTITAAAFHKGKQVSTNSVFKVSLVKPAPPLMLFRAPDPGLMLDKFAGDWDKLPDFTKLVSKSSQSVADVSLEDLSKPEEYVGRRYTGYLMVPEADVYTFALTSDDGSRLWIDGKLISDNDGLHSPATVVGQAALAAGPHQIEIGWFNKSGGAALSLAWGALGKKLVPVSGAALGH